MEITLKIENKLEMFISDFRKEQSFYCLVVCLTRSRADQQWDEDVSGSLMNMWDIGKIFSIPSFKQQKNFEG